MEKSNTTKNIQNHDIQLTGEITFILNSAISQLEKAMGFSDKSILELIAFFTNTMADLEIVSESLEALSDCKAKVAIQQNFQNISEKMDTAVVEFQFYDKFAQQLSHIINSLAHLVDLMGDPLRKRNLKEWHVLKFVTSVNLGIDMGDDIIAAMEKAVKNGNELEEDFQKSKYDEDMST